MKTSGHGLIILFVALAGPGIAGEQATNSTYRSIVHASVTPPVVGPRIAFDSTLLDFRQEQAGRVIRHTFVYTNTGDQTLEIKDVRPTCGCTITGAWDARVEPGLTGNIPIQYTPAQNSGEVLKTVIVLCNDPGQSNITLQIKGRVWDPIEVVPAFVMFGMASLDCQTNQVRVVHIVNHEDQPLTLSSPECDNPAFQASLKTIQPGKEFELHIALLPSLTSGNLTTPISLKTSSTNMPAISLTVVAVVLPPVMATPSRITLPPGTLPAASQFKITIQNHRTGPLVVSEPEINVSGVEVRLQEIQPGRQFVLTANFPAGFQIQRGQNVQVRVKTNDPQYPNLTVPVNQNFRLADTLNSTDLDLLMQEQRVKNQMQ